MRHLMMNSADVPCFAMAKRRLLLFAALLAVVASPVGAASVFTTRPDDPAAVDLSAPDFGARGDGTTDDSAAIQSAIDKAAANGLGGGIVFVPSGRYRLTRTIYVWRAVRIIGYGPTRPVFVLADNTPGYQKGIGLMVMYTHGGPAGAEPAGRGGRVPFPPPGTVPPNDDIPDATPSTFYPAMSNIDFEIGGGNPAAVAIRFHVAQHGYLTHMDFHIGSGLAALTQIGNEAEDLRFYGGRYGILTDNPSPFWQFTLIDSVFEGQREAAIREHMAQLTLIRDTFRNVPIAIDIDPHYSDQLWVKDSRFENVSRAAVVISNEKNPSTEIGFENALCSNVPVFARFRESGKTQAGAGAFYRVSRFNYGLFIPGEGTMGHFDTRYDAAVLDTLPAPLPPAIRALPPTDDWVNVRTLGVKGDGQTDDTVAIQQAVDTHPVLYFPTGFYIVRDTIRLKPDTVLIALHPGLTQLDVPDGAPGYQGVGGPKPVLEAPRGGNNIVSNLGIFTGAVNPRAVGILWMAGEDSLMDDVQFHGGAGGFLPAAVRSAFYGTDRGGAPARPFSRGRDGAQYPSLWVTHGGGGTFANIWTPDTHAQAGLWVSDTTTPGHVYELSNEHHLFNEIKLDHVENWDFNAPQTEEEAASSPEAVSLEIRWSKNITIANYHGYRVTRSEAPFPAAVRLYNSSDIHFRNVHVNAESGYGTCDENGCGTFLRVSKFPYENAVQDMTHHLEVREHEFAVLDVPAHPAAPPPADASAVMAPGAKVERLEDGFSAIGGAAVDDSGRLYFVDRHQQRIFSWSRADGLNIVRSDPLDPVNLAVDRSGNLMVVSSAGHEGSVYSIRPGEPSDRIAVLEPKASTPHSGAAVAQPVNIWDNGEFANQLDLSTYEYTTLAEMFARDVETPKVREYVSPDGSLVLPAGRVFRQGPDGFYPGMDPTGWRWSNNLDAYGFVTALPGQRVYVSSESEDRTYRATVKADGTLGDLAPFAERGGESVTVDTAGHVYVANGQIFVYDQAGTVIGQIDVPERPIDILFGGPDRRTLFILGHHTLYALATRAPGEASPWTR
jgi:Pectate lyase superfamily protein/SMP-30/Gluconolactonase/LRE-like region